MVRIAIALERREGSAIALIKTENRRKRLRNLRGKNSFEK
jgi:hypothetical protein